MPAHYEITTLTFKPNGVGPALPALERSVTGSEAPGRLNAVWISEIGALNQVMIVHTIDDAAKAHASRDARLRNPFGVSEQLAAASSATYVSFPTLPPMPAGRFGPVFEVREYRIRPHALAPLLNLWSAALPARIAMSPVLTVAYALEGDIPRMLHVWPYADLNERARLRSEAVAKGVWPPKGGADFLASMHSTIYVAAPFSPLQ